MANLLKTNLHPGFGLGGEFARTLNETVTPMFKMGTDEYWMEQALQIAMNAVGWSAPNPSVGCVIVKNNQALASGFTQAFRHEHAERMAFNEISSLELLKGATVFVTLEPCTHFGSQPPCVDLLVNSPIERVVIACVDPDSRVNGSGVEKLKLAGKKVTLGVLQKEASAWHFPFLRNRVTGKPVWIGKWAQTPDGYLANSEGESKWITNVKSRAYTHWLRQKYDAILVGAETWIKDEPQLTVRDCALPHRRNPKRLVFDPSGKVHQGDFKNTLVFTCIDRLAKDSDPRIWIPIQATRESPTLLNEFKRAVESAPSIQPLQSVFCEGGAQLLNLLIQSDMLDAIHIFTGQKKWAQNLDRYRVQIALQEKWYLEAQHYFDDDYLQEWVKYL